LTANGETTIELEDGTTITIIYDGDFLDD